MASFRHSRGKVIALLCFALALVGWALLLRAMSKEPANLPPADRQVLVERTLETLRTTCNRERGPALDDFCDEQARFIERLPECTAECRAVVTSIAHRPTR